MRTKLAVIADSHFDEHSRFDECIRIHSWIAADAARRGCTVWAHAGDVYERKSTPIERLAVSSWVMRMTELVGPGVIVRGNHDATTDLPLLGRLDMNGRFVHVVEDARVLHFGGISFGCLAWPARAYLHTMGATRDEVESSGVDALRNVLRGLGTELAASREDEPRVLLSHAMVRASRVSTGQPLTGCDFELGLDDLGLAGANFYALGHVHLGQDWDIAGAPAVYPGSPRRTAFGELETKGYLVVEFDGPRLVDWERIETPCTPMIQLDGSWLDGQLVGLEHPPLTGAEVRLRYRVQSDKREAAKAAALEWRDRAIEAGVKLVKLEERVEAVTRARMPEIATASTPFERLERYWSATGFAPGERHDSLIAKFGKTQQGADDAAA
jgi:DNA repair exonuclease SbcCD nuclease subunit